MHVHHLAGLDLDPRALAERLDLGFDVTVHDYFAICPQLNLAPGPHRRSCAEPGPATCNACIAQRPSLGARDILSWRHGHARLLLEAERVLCPSEDVRARLARHGLARNAVLAPHEPVTEKTWIVRPPPLPAGRPLRIAVLGVLAGHKGEISVVTLAEATPAARLSFHLIGYAERDLPAGAAARISVTGEYQEADLPRLLAAAKPHVVWFPAPWPETYSYTLSAALQAKLPIVATRIGAFPERLQGRPLTWLVDPAATTEDWRAVFHKVRTALGHKAPKPAARQPIADFYARDYADPLRAPAVRRREIDLRQPGQLSVVVIPERLANGALSPCAYIRLLQPLDHPAIGGAVPSRVPNGSPGGVSGETRGGDRRGMHVVMAEPHELSRFRADIVATQRYAIPDVATADALAERCRATGARLLYDIDDDLLHIPRDHPEADVLRPRARTVARMLSHADAVWVSTPGLAEALRPTQATVRVVPNGLDERLWGTPPVATRPVSSPVRLLFMGTATHGADWAVVAPALARVVAAFEGGVSFDMLGVLGPEPVPDWVNRISPPNAGAASYPGFVHWITGVPAWDIGIAPLADSAFNRSKSAIKTLDYAALGLAVLASDVPAYRGSLADASGARAAGADAPRVGRAGAGGARVGDKRAGGARVGDASAGDARVGDFAAGDSGAGGAGANGDGAGRAGTDRIGGMLVANTEAAWFDALCRLIRDAALRRRLAAGARAAFAAQHTLAAQAAARRAAWRALAPATTVPTTLAPATTAPATSAAPARAKAPAATSPRRRPARLAAD